MNSLELLNRRIAESRDLYDDEQSDDGTGYQAFRLLRSERATIAMLQLRLRTGDSEGFDYHWLSRLRHTSQGIRLSFGSAHVTIGGRHLGPLAEALLAKRVRWIWEADLPTSLLVPQTEPLVTSITIEET